MEIFIVGIILVVFMGGLLVFLNMKFQNISGSDKEVRQLRERLDQTTKDVNETLDRVTTRLTERLDKVTDQVSVRLTENVKAINESKSFLTGRVDNTEKTVREVTNKLSGLQEASEKMIATNNEILNFQQMLKVPKVRGGFGEILLESLLRDSLPHDRFEMQYKFQMTGDIADAVIKLMDQTIVVIDSKFPLANFERVIVHEGEEKKQLYRAFINDVKKHVKDISRKYIVPTERTLDYAFMYVPMEGIYYEMVVRRAETSEEIWDFCLKHKVIPVSPNSFVSYLHTLLMGFKGMKIEKQAREILSYIGQIRNDFTKFSDEFGTIGTHLTHAQNKYLDSSKRLDKLGGRLEHIDIPNEQQKLPDASPDVSNEELIAEELS